MSEISDVFHFDQGKSNFNDIAVQGEITHWLASDFMKMLGYSSYSSFQKIVNKGITACMTLGIDVMQDFRQTPSILDGKQVMDYQLSRFACYLVAMNADPKKEQVAKAQAFFATLAESFRRYVEEAEEVERVLVRDEISAHEKTLSSVAKNAGVDKYALFQNAGYRGMYNMNLSDLKLVKGLQGRKAKRSLLDFMGKEELAANLFRVTQTEAKIRNEGIKGQRSAEKAAEQVGRTVRRTMIDISGTTPESLPLSEDIKKVKSSIKASKKDFEKLDSQK
ncbi:BRO family protein [Endozoicomonas sp. ONNA1]|uniref:BRO family protein n=1 Tax=Endozoicomonas sp. ONNA1 TaxID=2828740 RepID=UPI0021497889|nr:BRO family protein [Endozoicomonas sp. ONNA1]